MTFIRSNFALHPSSDFSPFYGIKIICRRVDFVGVIPLVLQVCYKIITCFKGDCMSEWENTLLEHKELLDDELIDQEDYQQAKEEVLNAICGLDDKRSKLLAGRACCRKTSSPKTILAASNQALWD